MRAPATTPGSRLAFFALPVVTLADSLYHRLQIRYPFGIRADLLTAKAKMLERVKD